MEAEDAASVGSSSSGIVEDAGLLSDVDDNGDNDFEVAHDDDLLYDVGYDTEVTETTDAVDDFIELDPIETKSSSSDGADDNGTFSVGHLIFAVSNNNIDTMGDDLDLFENYDDEDRHATGYWTSTESLYNGDTDIADIVSYDLAPESSDSQPQTRKRLRSISDSTAAVVNKKRRVRQFEMVQLYTALESE